MSIFTGLSAFPLTPANADGVVDTDALGILVDRLASAGVDSVSVLGSTGTYAYLDRDQRTRAVTVAVEAARGRVPVVAGIGALRTSWSRELARAAERAGASGLLLAPMSYTPLTDEEVRAHFVAVAGATDLPLCIYNNPGTTSFVFSHNLIAQLAAVSGIQAVKMPPLEHQDYAGELGALRARTPSGFKIGYSGDWCAAPSLLAGGDAWHSVIAGILPEPALRLIRAARAGDVEKVEALEAAFAPLWSLFRTYGSLRLIYEIAERMGLAVGNPPLPLMRCGSGADAEVEAALERLGSA
jgi:4-hydroxy-tetrahydrodipicolinate synthase